MTSFPQPGLLEILARVPVIPVVIIDNIEDAVPLARALVAGGLSTIEITLRTKAALDCIRAIAAEVEDVVVGAGTILVPGDLEAATAHGARFAVSPGWTARLLDAAEHSPTPLLPGIATVSEAIGLIERSYNFAKFFPAEPAGGATYLAALASPLPQLKFCPTGGIGPHNAPKYFALANVVCVGGSWMVPRDKIAAKDWDFITATSKAAMALGTRAQA